MRTAFSLAFCVTLLTLPLFAERLPDQNWPRWRGPNDSGSAESGPIPSSWSDEANIKWKVKLPGRGCSTPAVWNDYVLVTCPVDEQDALVALDWRGQTRWQTKVGTERSGKHRNGSGSNPSPVTDGKLVFVYYKSGNLACIDFEGALLWKTNLQDRFAKDTLYWDLGTSPVLTKDNVVVAVMHKGESYLAAFDKQSGKLTWKVARNYDCPVEGDHSYATPLLVDRDGRQEIVVWGAEHLTGHAVEDGRVLWSCGGFNPEEKRNWVVVASAVIAKEVAIVPFGRGSHLAGVRLGKSGDLTDSNRLWTRDDTGAFIPTPVVHQGQIILLRDKGEVECIQPESGKSIWTGKLPKHRAKYYASPLVADGKLYAPREDGVVVVARIDGKFEVLSENDMGQQVIASPVAVNGHLLIRGEEHLFCISK